MSFPHPITPPVIGCHTRWFARRGGFALLITITLLAFLVLLLVSLASLTRVETQVAANNTQLAQARANALFALNLAVGQLQKYAGPDQAVTARADIDSLNTGNPMWTGVWDAVPRDAAGAALATPTHAAAPASAAPMAWLVSGNETNGTEITPVTAAVADPAPGNDNVWLVRKVFGEDMAAQLPDYPKDGRVKLTKTLIQVPANQLPGLGTVSTTATPVGAYAWWVGDEGIKAKINLADPYRSAAVSDPEADWRRLAAPRPSLEVLTADMLKGAFTATTTSFEAKRAGLLTYQQLPMLSEELAIAPGIGQTSRAFHDLTTVGHGVLADTLRGGLRRDLTRGLASSPSAGSIAIGEIGDDLPVFSLPDPGAYGRTAKSTASSKHVWTSNAEPHAPTWGEVRAWAGIRAPSGGIMPPRGAPLVDVTKNGFTCPAPAGHAIMPVPVMMEIGYGLDVGPDSQFRVMIRPVLVLMNPYNVTLSSDTYSMVYKVTGGSKSNLSFSLTPDATYNGPDPIVTPPPPTVQIDPRLDQIIAIDGSPQMAFNITDGFGPGEIKVYSLPASSPSDVLLDGTASIMELEPGLSTVRAYLVNSSDPVPSWYAQAKRDKITAQVGHLPQDRPYFTFSLGKAVPGKMPIPSIYTRFVETSSSIYSKQYPKARLTTDQARQLRTLRFTLRHAEMDMVNDAISDVAAQNTLGMDLSDDLASGARFLIDNNPRAVVSQRLSGRDGVAHYTVSSIKVSSYTNIDYDDSSGAALAYWGGGVDAASGTTHAILFDVLRSGEEIVSLGRLGQFNWGVDAKHPAYPLGNSFASIFYNHNQPDYGYALNEALWDRFFLSTLPVLLAARPAHLPNSRLGFYDPAGVAASLGTLEGENGYQFAATRLMIDGAFNINSTSTEAWAAFLGSVQASDYSYQSRAGAHTDSAVRAYPRVQNLHDPDPTASGQSGNMREWSGYRRLSAVQLQQLAAEIVKGIKARGRPARSLAEFMNRELTKFDAPPLAATDGRNQEGIVQAAINAVINTDKPAVGGGGVGLGDLPGLNAGKVVAATFGNGDNPDAARGKMRAAGAPGFLMQSDLLSPLAPTMAARSDTFRVRTYGEVRNPVTGEINSRAWCEAVVQRQPEFIDQSDTGLAALGNATAPGSTNLTNRTFGRKFVIVQFRWLGSDEI